MSPPVDRIGALRDLYDRTLEPVSDEAQVSQEIHAALLGVPGTAANYFVDLQSVQTLVRRMFPQASITAGLCYLSGHATVIPEPGDGRDARRYDEDIHEDDGVASVSHQCVALLRCLIAAVLDREMPGGFHPRTRPESRRPRREKRRGTAR